jgi:signal transduction histidine kinase
MHKESEVPIVKEEIDQLNQQAWEVRVNDSNRSFALSKEAHDLAESIGYTRGKAEALRTMGFCYIRLSKNSDAQACCEESFKLYESLNDVAGQGYLYTGFGIIQRNLGNYKTALELFYKSLELIKLTNYREVEPLVYYHIGVTNKYMGNLEQALEYILKCLSTGREMNSWVTEAYTLNTLGTIYDELGDYDHALDYYRQSLVIRKQAGDKWGEAGSLDNIGNIYLKQGDYNNAIVFFQQSLGISRTVGDKKGEANALFHLAKIGYLQNNQLAAFEQAQQSLQIREEIADKKGQAEIYVSMADWKSPELREEEQVEQQLNFLNYALALGQATGAQDTLLKIHSSLYKRFKQQNQFEEALLHLETYNTIEREIHSKSFNQKIINLEITHKVEQSKKEAEIYKLRNVELANLYEETKKQREEIQSALTDLKATQAQLIQSEKMASLGELTAGIAHEIQNPLNFVNNFSDVNTELIDELKEELATGNRQQAIEIADDIKANEEKINHHGKRADAIVKGMLQHSRTSSGQKEPTDINALADEYLRLAYHGLRAKDKSFNATMKTDFDESIGSINIIPQDIGRVVLNLINNAFYAVDEKMKKSGNTYEPIVTVSTRTVKPPSGGLGAEIRVADNGNGIPEKVLDKIFQPFFTTKPTGEGTGLGLSLSYDIVKAHGGELKVETKEGVGTTFIINLG